MNKIVASVICMCCFIIAACTTVPELKQGEQVIDTRLNGTWLVSTAELGGRSLVVPPAFELKISGTQYHAGFSSDAARPGDRGRIVLFGDELAGQAARVDVVGEDGPNEGKRFPAIYRFGGNPQGHELEMCYDLSEKERPTEFVSREQTMLLRVIYTKK